MTTIQIIKTTPINGTVPYKLMHDGNRPYQEGRKAAQDGLDWTANPYSDFSPASRNAKKMWASGYHREEA